MENGLLSYVLKKKNNYRRLKKHNYRRSSLETYSMDITIDRKYPAAGKLKLEKDVLLK